MIESDSRTQTTAMRNAHLSPPALGAALVFLLIGSLVSSAALAQPAKLVTRAKVGCPPQIEGQLLRQPPVIDAESGQLTTSLVVRNHDYPCVPVFVPSTTDEDDNKIPARWEWQSMTLRTYFHPDDPLVTIDPDNPADPNLVPSIPGPTLMMRKPTLPGNTGDSLNLTLYNRLPNNNRMASECDPAEYNWKCASGTNAGKDCFPAGDPPGDPCDSLELCVGEPLPQISPECFHGPDVTNVHYHGTHVSPQEHQDYVLVKVFSSEQSSPEPPEDCATDPECAIGSYATDMDPLTYEQAPGTHWYHPHKHGSTSVQVLNGMAGALLIKGPFDDWLEDDIYGGDLEEKVLVVQQFAEDLAFFLPGSAAPRALVNGQANPMIVMQPGEIQRWRFIGATMQASAALRIGFEGTTGGPEYRQIAQDGVQFSPENYQLQPFTGQPIVEDGAARAAEVEDTGFVLFPGNRADFLIKAPLTPGHYFMTQEIAANLGEQAQEIFKRTAQQVLDAGSVTTDNPPLLHIFVPPVEASTDTFPTVEEWPEMPSYLANLDQNPAIQKTVDFGMTGGPGAQANCFFVGKAGLENAQYKDGCAFETMTLQQTEQWTVTNDSSPNHPFHIHINPFQILETKGVVGGAFVHNDYSASPIWMDTIALPGSGNIVLSSVPTEAECVATNTGNAEIATCVNDWGGTPEWQASKTRCRCAVPGGHVRLVQKPTDFTGPYVIHCHFLGHEDRGMMQNVQSVCSNGEYGHPEAGGTPNECRSGNTFEALPVCTGNVFCNADGYSEEP